MVAADGTVQFYALFIGILSAPRSNHGSAFGDRASYRAVHDSAHALSLLSTIHNITSGV